MHTMTAKSSQPAGKRSASNAVVQAPRREEDRRLTDPDVQANIAKLSAEIRANPAVGVKMLQRIGILNKKGNLAKAYGG